MPGARERKKRGARPDEMAFGVRLVLGEPSFVIVSKPVGLVCEAPSGRRMDRTVNLAVEQWLATTGRAGDRYEVITQIDPAASGLVLYALSAEANTSLREQDRSGNIKSMYHALVEGTMADEGPESEGTIQTPLVKGRTGSMREADRDDRDARRAMTRFKVEKSGASSLVQLRPKTELRHQPRAHLASIGHPIVGDRTYGAASGASPRLMLHRTELSFEHPEDGRLVRMRDEPGREFTPAPVREKEQDEAPTDTSWEPVAEWYDTLIQSSDSDHYRDVILPGVERLIEPKPGMRFLDIACGQGVLCRRFETKGVTCVGVDAAPGLIERAREHGPESIRYEVGDARKLAGLNVGVFDSAACVMAIMNIEPFAPVLTGAALKLEHGGRFVLVLLHPAFRNPGLSGWVDEDGVIKREIDAYLSPAQREIVMNPGGVRRGEARIATWTFHRPLEAYINALGESGFMVDRIEEWTSERSSEGPTAQAENRARKEFPLFLAIRAVRT